MRKKNGKVDRLRQKREGERRKGGGGGKSDAIDTLNLQKEKRKVHSIFSPSKCYRKTYITMTGLCPRQAHKNTQPLFHLPQIVINKKPGRAHTQRQKIDEKEQWRVKKERQRREIML